MAHLTVIYTKGKKTASLCNLDLMCQQRNIPFNTPEEALIGFLKNQGARTGNVTLISHKWVD